MSAVCREAEAFLRELEAAGWTRKRGRKHAKMLSPDGLHVVVVPSTPSDRRALTNVRALVKRLGRI